MRKNHTRVLPILLALLCQLVFMRLPALGEVRAERVSTANHSQSKCEMATAVWNGAALSASKPAQQAKFGTPIRSNAFLFCAADFCTFGYATLAILSDFNRCSGQPLWLLNCALLR